MVNFTHPAGLGPMTSASIPWLWEKEVSVALVNNVILCQNMTMTKPPPPAPTTKTTVLYAYEHIIHTTLILAIGSKLSRSQNQQTTNNNINSYNVSKGEIIKRDGPHQIILIYKHIRNLIYGRKKKSSPMCQRHSFARIMLLLLSCHNSMIYMYKWLFY